MQLNRNGANYTQQKRIYKRRRKIPSIIPLRPPAPADDYNDRTPLQRCREIMCSTGIEYTDEELIEVRDFLYHLAAVTELRNSHHAHPAIIIPLTPSHDLQHEESHSLRTG